MLPQTYLCPSCDGDRPASSFGRTKDRPRRFQNCRKCRRTEAINAGKCSMCLTRPTIAPQKRCERCLAISRASSLKRHRAMRLAALAKYATGIICCACCGEPDLEFLTLDHTNNDGAEHRRSLRSNTIWNWLKQARYPTGFQILCFNCNIAKSIYGVCPHEARRTALLASDSLTRPATDSAPTPASGS